MKKITKSLIAVFAITTTLVSCTKDDKEPTASMEGKWIVDNIVFTMPNTAPKTVDINGDCTVDSYFDVQKGGGFEEGDVDSESCELTKLAGTWKKTDNTLEITTDGEKIPFNITSITSNKLVLKATDFSSELPAGTYAVLNLSKKQ